MHSDCTYYRLHNTPVYTFFPVPPRCGHYLPAATTSWAVVGGEQRGDVHLGRRRTHLPHTHHTLHTRIYTRLPHPTATPPLLHTHAAPYAPCPYHATPRRCTTTTPRAPYTPPALHLHAPHAHTPHCTHTTPATHTPPHPTPTRMHGSFGHGWIGWQNGAGMFAQCMAACIVAWFILIQT